MSRNIGQVSPTDTKAHGGQAHIIFFHFILNWRIANPPTLTLPCRGHLSNVPLSETRLVVKE